MVSHVRVKPIIFATVSSRQLAQSSATHKEQPWNQKNWR